MPTKTKYQKHRQVSRHEEDGLEPRVLAPVPRLLFIDNLRVTMILLVISMHAADTYSPLGNWYFRDRRPLSATALLTFAAWQMYLQSFFMGLLFFIAGYFAPGSVERKGLLRFVRERAFRLGLPVLFYMFILGPITEYFCAHSWTSTEPTSFGNEWVKHIRNGEFLQENGPLWFCLALLIFSVVYAGCLALRGRRGRDNVESRAPNTAKQAGFAIVMAAFTFVVRLSLPSGTSILNLHLGDFPQYVLLFTAGILAARGNWLLKLNFALGLRSLMVVLPAGFVAWFLILWQGGAFTGNSASFVGGWHWQSASLDLWESFTCVSISFGLLVIYRELLNWQRRLGKFLSDNAFAVYVFHPPIVILSARALRPVVLPSILKFVVLTCMSAMLSFALSAMVFRRIPLLRSIL